MSNNDSKNIDIGKRIKDLIDAKKITQKALAEETGISESSLSRIVNGDNLPDIEEAVTIAEALEVPLDYIAGVSNIKDPMLKNFLDFKKVFSKITTTTKFSKDNCDVFQDNDFVFRTEKEYLLLSTNKIDFISAIASAENSTPKLTKPEYNRRIQAAKKEYKKDKGEDKTYFLVSGEQMTEIIEQAVADKIFREAYLLKLQDTEYPEDTPHMEKFTGRTIKDYHPEFKNIVKLNEENG